MEKQEEFSESQLYKIGTIYEFLARLLPVEGRDYSVIFSFDDKNDPESIGISFKYYTEIGKIWCAYCTRALANSRD